MAALCPETYYIPVSTAGADPVHAEAVGGGGQQTRLLHRQYNIIYWMILYLASSGR